MPTSAFDYSIIRLVPRVERQEFLNVGVLLSCPSRRFLQARVELNAQRLRSFAPAIDVDTVASYLQSITVVCAGGDRAGPLGKLPQRARFHWLVAPRSTMIQFSPVHSGLCDDPETTLGEIMTKMVLAPTVP